jgi:hypothetical protein
MIISKYDREAAVDQCLSVFGWPLISKIKRSQPSAAPTWGMYTSVGAAEGCDLLILLQTLIILALAKRPASGQHGKGRNQCH